ncbi:DUF559 domain-containing protein [Kytococcus aerolatus]|uniref:DUF559 domain-containing protein n=1 Tax=Kytococcus aerolatus TaxID=592308 RepID=UPI000B58A3A4|nr:DUF559 domain-containing protein [Kytococcus aerolatus]
MPRGDSRVIGLPWAVLGVAEEGLEAAVVAGDAALHRQLVTRGQLLEVAAVQPRRRGSGTLGRAVARMDPACESPGESLSRLLLGRLGFRVRSQVQLVDRYGAFLARVDFLVEGSRVVVEFDGLGKYATPDDLRREKLRQERLEREGYVVVRLVWGDLQHPAEVDARIRRALARAGSARRPSPAARAGHRKR